MVVAANAGGAWSPIGDVTTTMLWIRHRISTVGALARPFIYVVMMYSINLQLQSHAHIYIYYVCFMLQLCIYAHDNYRYD